MPTCPSCGKEFSGFSFGSRVPTECRDCAKAKAPAAVVSGASVAGVASASLPIVTCTIIALNVLVYLAMGLSGASWTEPSVEQAIRWGADFGPLTLSSEPWRLLTSTFVHFGIVHIGLNMWCLWGLGASLEPLMGRKAFAVMYGASGLAASIVSVAWNPWRVSAGASGAIFGAAGALVSFFALKKAATDQTLVRKNLKGLAIFILYNLLHGLGGTTDNSAHIGGLLAGLVLGAIIPSLKQFRVSPAGGAAAQVSPVESIQPFDAGSSQESSVSLAVWSVALGAVILSIIGVVTLRKGNVAAMRYSSAVKLVRSGHLDQGIAEMMKAVKLDPNLLLGQALLGEWELERADPRAAVPILEQALVLAPNAYDIQHNLALAYLGSGDSANAMGEIARALDHEHEEVWRAYFILGVAARGTGDLKMAAQDLQSVVQANPNFYEAKSWLALVDLERNREVDARGLYTDVLAANPSDSVATAGMNYLNSHSQKTQIPPRELAEIALPYSTLAVKSDAWPYFP